AAAKPTGGEAERERPIIERQRSRPEGRRSASDPSLSGSEADRRGGGARATHHCVRLLPSPFVDVDRQLRLLTANAVDVISEAELRAKLERETPLRVKLGIDPTASDVHL